jgi:hypothetical protein
MKNIFLFVVARSGSSLLTDIIRRHAFTAPVGPVMKNRDGSAYRWHEDMELKKWFTENRISRDGDLTGFHSFRDENRVADIIRRRIVPPFVLKLGVEKYKAVEPVTVGATIIKLKRDPGDNARSMAAKRSEDFERVLELVKAKHKLLDTLPGFDVKIEDILRGDYRSLKMALEDAGAVLDEAKIIETVDYSQWHYRESLTNER